MKTASTIAIASFAVGATADVAQAYCQLHGTARDTQRLKTIAKVAYAISIGAAITAIAQTAYAHKTSRYEIVLAGGQVIGGFRHPADAQAWYDYTSIVMQTDESADTKQAMIEQFYHALTG